MILAKWCAAEKISGRVVVPYGSRVWKGQGGEGGRR